MCCRKWSASLTLPSSGCRLSGSIASLQNVNKSLKIWCAEASKEKSNAFKNNVGFLIGCNWVNLPSVLKSREDR